MLRHRWNSVWLPTVYEDVDTAGFLRTGITMPDKTPANAHGTTDWACAGRRGAVCSATIDDNRPTSLGDLDLGGLFDAVVGERVVLRERWESAAAWRLHRMAGFTARAKRDIQPVGPSRHSGGTYTFLGG